MLYIEIQLFRINIIKKCTIFAATKIEIHGT